MYLSCAKKRSHSLCWGREEGREEGREGGREGGRKGGKNLLELREEATPLFVLREEGGMQHVWIGQENICVFSYVLTVGEGSVTVISLAEGGREGGRERLRKKIWVFSLMPCLSAKGVSPS